MDGLVNFIISLFDFRGKIIRRIYTGLCGFVIVCFFLFFYTYVVMKFSSGPYESSDYQEQLGLVLTLLSIIVLCYLMYFLIKYLSLLLITLVRYGFSPSSKDSESSIEALMTSAVEDRVRMRKEIVKFLKESPTPKNFAALHIWLCERHLILTTENKTFIEALLVDFPNAASMDNNNIVARVPATSSFSEQKTELEKNNKEEYKNLCFSKYFDKRFCYYIDV